MSGVFREFPSYLERYEPAFEGGDDDEISEISAGRCFLDYDKKYISKSTSTFIWLQIDKLIELY